MAHLCIEYVFNKVCVKFTLVYENYIYFYIRLSCLTVCIASGSF